MLAQAVPYTSEELDLAELWLSLVAGRWFVTTTACRGGRCFAELILRETSVERPPAVAFLALERVLAGEPQKVVAEDLGYSLSGLSMLCSSALRMMTAEAPVSRTSILLVAAAFAAHGWPLPKARIEAHAERRLAISIDLPGRELTARLSVSEAEVLHLLLEGRSHADIAAQRSTACRTIANQLGAIFRKTGISGRAALRARAVEEHSRGWTNGGAPLGVGPRLSVVCPRWTLSPS